MNKQELDNILKEHIKWINNSKEGSRAYLSGANLTEANLRGAKGILSFVGEKDLLIYFKTNNVYYFTIGCQTHTSEYWLKHYKTIGIDNNYGNNTELYGDVIKLFSKYELI